MWEQVIERVTFHNFAYDSAILCPIVTDVVILTAMMAWWPATKHILSDDI